MHTLKKVKQFQQDMKYNLRKYELLQNILEQVFENIDYCSKNEEFSKGLAYLRECDKWFKQAEYEVFCMLTNKEDELESVQNSLPSEYCNIIFIMSEIASDDSIL